MRVSHFIISLFILSACQASFDNVEEKQAGITSEDAIPAQSSGDAEGIPQKGDSDSNDSEDSDGTSQEFSDNEGDELGNSPDDDLDQNQNGNDPSSDSPGNNEDGGDGEGDGANDDPPQDPQANTSCSQ